jgi:hypothetical protein
MSVISGGRSSRAELIAKELASCRRRGLETLDVDNSRQPAVDAPQVEKLAYEHARRHGKSGTGRKQQIKALLSDALQEYSALESEEDARLIRSLFFSDPTLTVRKPAGQLLEEARRSFGEPSVAAFRQRFQAAFGNFADFLAQFMDSSVEVGVPPETDQARTAGSRLQVAAGVAGSEPDRFIELLAESTRATVVGFDNELLVEALRKAIDRKRERLNDPDAFWDSLEIVFFGEHLLDYLDDDSVSPDWSVAVRERRRAMTATRRAVQLLLRKTGCVGWTLSDSPFMPAFTGSLFVLPGPRHVVQLVVRQPDQRARNVYHEFDDLPNESYANAFRRLVVNSITDNRPVPVGNPFGRTFVRTGTFNREAVLKPGSRRQDWLPMVLVVTTQRRRGVVAPVLQVRTQLNAVRELDTVSHLSRHIYQDEIFPAPGTMTISAPQSFDAESACAMRAAQLRVQIETGDKTPLELHEIATGKYINPDTDNLFFFVYSLELADQLWLRPDSDMYHFTLDELVKIRAHQALRIACELCKISDRPPRFWRRAVELATLNLVLHDFHELGERLDRVADERPEALAELSSDIETLIRKSSPSCASSGRDIRIVGLSGWQYREFYTVLVPQYAKAGVPAASEEMSRIKGIIRGSAGPVYRRVESLYQDEDLLRSISVEL